MDTIGLDLRKRASQLCILTEDGELLEQRIVTVRERLTAVLGARPRARLLLEASTESEWVARHLESVGHELVVADPGFAPMYATRSTRVKTDKRDARALCEALRLGAYRPIHRASDAQRQIRAQLAVRDALVRTRTRYVALIKAAVRDQANEEDEQYEHHGSRSASRRNVCGAAREVARAFRQRCPSPSDASATARVSPRA